MRLVSLLPSATEIVYALGLGDDLVGVTFECDEPADARATKTVVVGGRDTRTMSPGEIDAYVRTQMAAGGDLYTLHAGALAGLNPDLILTQDLCRVCAVPSGHVDDALTHLGCRSEVLALDPHTLADVLATFTEVASAVGVPERGLDLVVSLQDRLERVSAAVAGRPRPKVAVVEWVDPPFGAGHWVPDMIVAAGGEPVAGRPGQRSVAVSWAELSAPDPDIVLVTPCGYHLDGAVQQAEAVTPHFPNAAVWAIDGDGLVVRPGPRLIDGVEAIAAVLHPGAIPEPPPGTVTRVACGLA